MKLGFYQIKFKGNLTVRKIWSFELVFALIFTSLFLLGDYWIYQRFIVNKKTADAGEAGAVSFKRASLDNANKKLRERNAFLENPVFFPAARSPF